MNRKFLALCTLILALCAGLFYSHTRTVTAQETYTEDDAITVAAEHPAFATGLDGHPGWTAAAYDTGNAYGIWRVQFWDANGDDLGWADVSPAKASVYSWESYVGASDALNSEAEPILRDFIANHPDILSLMQDPAQYDLYIDYDSSGGFWGVYIARGADSVYAVVDFEDDFAFTSPKLSRLYFEVMGYEEWFAANEDLATSKAFEQPEIAAAVNGVEGWEAHVERGEDNLWTVYFMQGDQALAQVTVNLEMDAIVEYNIAGM